ncbi:MAG: hypothetical protein Q7R98_03000 [Candidatus Jorgensenbacteria bacterium]|nr:hypothetical protein [Candidatus Jorgensenbacteria bacterium]
MGIGEIIGGLIIIIALAYIYYTASPFTKALIILVVFCAVVAFLFWGYDRADVFMNGLIDKLFNRLPGK